MLDRLIRAFLVVGGTAGRTRRAARAHPPQYPRERRHRERQGEVRGAEAADLLQALNTGHGGSLTTVHANNADSALFRLARCAMQGGGDLPWDVTYRGVVDGIAIVIHMTRREGRRFVEEAAVVHGYDAGTNTWDSHRLDHVTVQGRVARTGASSPSSPRGEPAIRRRVETSA